MCPRNQPKLDDRTGIDPVVEKLDNAHMQLGMIKQHMHLVRNHVCSLYSDGFDVLEHVPQLPTSFFAFEHGW